MRRTHAIALAGTLLLLTGLGCEQHAFKTCDITQRACQQDVYYHMLSLRGDGYDPFGGLPPVTVITEDQFRAQLEREQATAAQSGPNPWDKALVLLHFNGSPSPPVTDAGAGGDGGAAANGDAGGDAGSSTSAIDDEVAHIYAYYDPETKTVTVISHPVQTGDHPLEEAMITLGHELVHALQDRELNLSTQDIRTSDEYLSYKGVVEGDARFYEDLFTNDIRVMLGLGALDALQMPDQEVNYAYSHFDQLGSPLFAAQYLMYPLGAKYEATEYRSGGNAAVRHGYAKAPRHTVGFLVGPDGRVPPVSSGNVSPAPAVCSLLTKNSSASADQFGAVLIYTFLRGWGVSHNDAFSTAQSWTGDYLLVQANSDVSVTAVAWRLEFSTVPPTRIAQALAASGELSVNAAAGSIEITVTDSPTPLVWQPSANCP